MRQSSQKDVARLLLLPPSIAASEAGAVAEDGVEGADVDPVAMEEADEQRGEGDRDPRD